MICFDNNAANGNDNGVDNDGDHVKGEDTYVNRNNNNNDNSRH